MAPDWIDSAVFLPITLRGSTQLDAEQRGGAAVQRVEADLDAREDRAAEVLALARDRFERGGGAEVDDDRRAAVEVEGGRRASAMRSATDLLRVVVEDRHAGLHARLDDDRRRSRSSARVISRTAAVMLGTDEHSATPSTSSSKLKPWKPRNSCTSSASSSDVRSAERRDAPVVEQVSLGARAWRLASSRRARTAR